MSWQPRAIMGQWTPDQQRVAAHFPEARRVCVCAANGVGKTYLAADLAVSFLFDHPSALVLFTAPTQRQVEQLLWPEIVRRLKHLSRMEADAPVGKPEWELGPHSLFGFATNQPERMQGFHAPYMLIVVDETSGMTDELLEAIESVAIGVNNYVFAIGNPNEPYSAFHTLTRRRSWRQETLSALTHPNIIERREIIPGATSWYALLQRVKDWCQPAVESSSMTFSLRLTTEEVAYLHDPNQTEPPRSSSPATVAEAGTSATTPPGERKLRRQFSLSPLPELGEGPGVRAVHFNPNDAFRVRYLGRFPAAGSDTLFAPELIEKSMGLTPVNGRKLSALDVARDGGDSTIYALRDGNAVTLIQEVPPGDFIEQADFIIRLLLRDQPESLTIDCAGLGIGLKDILFARRGICPIYEFQPAGSPGSPQDQKKFLNRRAKAYGNLADAMRCNAVSLPEDPELRDDLGAIRCRHTDEQQLQILSKEFIKADIGRSPDRADTVAMLWENEMPPRLPPIRPSRLPPDSDFSDKHGSRMPDY